MARNRLPPATSLVWPACILLVFAVVALWAIAGKNATYDEPKYLRVGQYLTTTWRWDHWQTTEHGPLSYVAHGLIGQSLPPDTSESRRLLVARSTMLPFALLLGIGVYVWARTAHGAKAGLLALTLWAALPDTLAHAPLITTDVLVACWLTWLGFCCWRWATSRRWRWAAAGGVAFGLALLSKFTALLWGPGLLALGITFSMVERQRGGENSRTLLRGFILMIALGWLVLCFGYGWNGVFSLWSQHAWGSDQLAGIGGLPLPLLAPLPWWQGIDFQSMVSEGGHPGYLLGEKFLHAPWYYLFVASFYKIPTPFIALLLLLPLATKRIPKQDWRGAFCLMAPPLALLLTLAFVTRVGSGFRYIYPLLPALCILLGRFASPEARMLPQVRSGARTLVVLCLVAAAWQYPNFHAYLNLFEGTRDRGYEIFADSSLDWGQEPLPELTVDDPTLMPIINPGPVPVRGRVLVDVNTYTDVFSRGTPHAWLREGTVTEVHNGVWLDIDTTTLGENVRPIPQRLLAGKSPASLLNEEPSLLYPLEDIETGYRWLALKAVEERDAEAATEALLKARQVEIARAYGTTVEDILAQPDSPRTAAELNAAGVASFLNGSMRLAVWRFGRALDAEPRMPSTYLNLAFTDAERGKYWEAHERQAAYDNLVQLTLHKPFVPARVFFRGERMVFGEPRELAPPFTLRQLAGEAHWAEAPTVAHGVARADAYLREGRLVEAGIALLELEAHLNAPPSLSSRIIDALPFGQDTSAAESAEMAEAATRIPAAWADWRQAVRLLRARGGVSA